MRKLLLVSSVRESLLFCAGTELCEDSMRSIKKLYFVQVIPLQMEFHFIALTEHTQVI